MKHTLRRNMISQYALQVAKYVFPLLTLPYLTRVLGKDGYAVRSYMLSFMAFVEITMGFGMGSFGTKEVAKNKEDSDKVNTIVSAIVFCRMAIAVVVFFAVLIIARYIPILAANMLYLMVAYVRGILRTSLPDFVFQGFEDMPILTYRYVGSQAVGLVLIYAFVKSPQDLLLVVIIETIAALVAWLWSWINAFQTKNLKIVKPSLDRMKTSIQGGLVYFISGASTTAYSSFTTIMIGMEITDPVIIAYWSLANTAVGAVQSLYSPISDSLFPHMVANKDIDLMNRLMKLGIPTVIVGSCAFWYLSDFIMLVLGGKDYLAGSYVIRMLTPLLFISFIGIMIGYPVLVAFGKEKKLTASSVSGAVFQIVCLVLLAQTNHFNIITLCVVRNLTEMLMSGMRLYYAFPYLAKKKTA